MHQNTLTFQEVYAQHFRFVWRSLRRLGVPECDTPDAVQDVYLVVHRRLGEFEGRAKLTTWLFGICYRVARDRRKLAHIRRRAGGDEPLLDCADERADVGAEAERRQALAMLEAILDEMPLDQRAVFTLFELEGATGEDIAEMLEVPLGTVYSRLRIAREVFRRSVARLAARDRFRQGVYPVMESKPVLKGATDVDPLGGEPEAAATRAAGVGPRQRFGRIGGEP